MTDKQDMPAAELAAERTGDPMPEDRFVIVVTLRLEAPESAYDAEARCLTREAWEPLCAELDAAEARISEATAGLGITSRGWAISDLETL